MRKGIKIKVIINLDIPNPAHLFSASGQCCCPYLPKINTKIHILSWIIPFCTTKETCRRKVGEMNVIRNRYGCSAVPKEGNLPRTSISAAVQKQRAR